MKYTMHRQTGAALIVSLLLLTVMTLLGISAVTSTTLEERMAGNVRNKHLSFQAAEAALRSGEAIAVGVLGTTIFDGTNGLYPRSQYGDPTYPIWEQPAGVNWQNVNTLGTVVVQSPQYIMENFGTAPRDNDCMLEVPPPPGCLLPVYRVTSRGWGTNTNAMSMVQSTYKQL